MNAAQQSYTVTTTPGFLDLDSIDFVPTGLFVTIEGGNIRIAYDGTLPAPQDGHLLFGGQLFTLSKTGLIQNFAMVAVTINATVTVTLES
jgi:hypothetical protein